MTTSTGIQRIDRAQINIVVIAMRNPRGIENDDVSETVDTAMMRRTKSEKKDVDVVRNGSRKGRRNELSVVLMMMDR
jgi:hypothetical protein